MSSMETLSSAGDARTQKLAAAGCSFLGDVRELGKPVDAIMPIQGKESLDVLSSMIILQFVL